MKMLSLGQCCKQGLDLAQETVESVDGLIQGQVHFPGQATSYVDRFGDIKTQPSHSTLGQFGWVIPVAWEQMGTYRQLRLPLRLLHSLTSFSVQP